MFNGGSSRNIRRVLVDVKTTVDFIKSVQNENGEIPWSPGGKTDPWDHVESAMGLTVGGYFREAEKAYEWSARMQLDDGSWWSCYYESSPGEETYLDSSGQTRKDRYKDTNMTAYIAVGVFHYYLATGDTDFLKKMWPCICHAMDYVLGMQGAGGEICWLRSRDNEVEPRALLTGSSSIFMSLGCALKIASVLGEKKPEWNLAKKRLGEAVQCRPDLFDQTKSNYSMDWYYPVLCGAVTGKKAAEHIDRSWDVYAVKDWGIRCVSERPWVTMAETAELVMALAAIGRYSHAEEVLGWTRGKQYDDGAYWLGVTFPDRVIYTDEKTSWTGAAVLLAADMLYGLTPACGLFSHNGYVRMDVGI
ncbi:MAG: phenyltransferase domain-containing protein [Desulfobacteraceae bacterium]|nr:phenyltransferase domain-containing protein [Desulfobacteraceae bacterium]